jgi:sporulation protein YlmC with PRC-barrel domain
MQLGNRLLDKPIITVGEGYLVGTVKDFYLDQELRALTGVFLGSEGLFSRKFKFMRREQVHLFGIDVVLAADAEPVLADEQTEEVQAWLRRENLKGREVQTPGGSRVGKLGDVIFDAQGRIIGFMFAEMFVKGPIAENQAIKRELVLDSGGPDSPMVIDLITAEKQNWFFEEL